MTTNYKTISATGSVVSHACLLHSITITAGSNAAAVELRDWTDATGGAVIIKVESLANISSTVVFDTPVRVKTGIYATLTGTNASATITTDRETDFTTTSTSTSTSTSTTTT